MNRFFLSSCAALTLIASACSSSNKDEPKELVKKELADIDASQEDLLATGKNFYAKKLYSISTESFSSLKNVYPIGPYREFAEIKTADSHFQSREYTLAAPLYENFVRDHPASPICPYATLMAGRSYQLSYGGLGRDTAPLEKALQMYKRLDRLYPTSPYAVDAKTLQRKIIQELIAKQEKIIDFYQRQEFDNAAQSRAEILKKDWEPRLEKIKRSERSAKQKRAAQKPHVALNQLPPLKVATLNKPQSVKEKESDTSSQNGINLLSCAQGMATFALNDRALLPEFNKVKVATPVDGKVSISISATTPLSVTDTTLDCFADKDLTITKNAILLTTTRRLLLFTLTHPMRLVIMPE